jgi:ABC-type ATPase involved in cell division
VLVTSRRSCWPTKPTSDLDSQTSVEIMQIFQDLNDRG